MTPGHLIFATALAVTSLPAFSTCAPGSCTESQSSGLRGGGEYVGLKLPAWRIGLRNASEFNELSVLPGQAPAELVGAYFNRALFEAGISFYAQGLLQAPLTVRPGYRAARRFSLTGGIDVESEQAGASGYFLSPGVSYSFTRGLKAYGFLQLPVSHQPIGFQPNPGRAAVVGVSARF